ncbi:hypothetical protein BDN71DRAFT_188127 [Pleurotus eryngii]|uniref:Uncharacterized protein n=1 Tax=Pleurotus eryngii TaxID=5323 RepID=A0A9P5ZN72_PLEER|nr:hypothetical protein BDN71DRAFT_188127 [Pleurotus eryngii]
MKRTEERKSQRRTSYERCKLRYNDCDGHCGCQRQRMLVVRRRDARDSRRTHTGSCPYAVSDELCEATEEGWSTTLPKQPFPFPEAAFPNSWSSTTTTSSLARTHENENEPTNLLRWRTYVRRWREHANTQVRRGETGYGEGLADARQERLKQTWMKMNTKPGTGTGTKTKTELYTTRGTEAAASKRHRK